MTEQAPPAAGSAVPDPTERALDVEADAFDRYDCRICGTDVWWTDSLDQVAARLCSTCHHSAEHGWLEPADARALRAEVAAVNVQMERMAREMGGQMDLIDQLSADNARLRAALALMMQAFDPDWPGACYQDCFDTSDGHGYEMQEAAKSRARAALAGQEERG